MKEIHKKDLFKMGHILKIEAHRNINFRWAVRSFYQPIILPLVRRFRMNDLLKEMDGFPKYPDPKPKSFE